MSAISHDSLHKILTKRDCYHKVLKTFLLQACGRLPRFSWTRYLSLALLLDNQRFATPTNAYTDHKEITRSCFLFHRKLSLKKVQLLLKTGLKQTHVFIDSSGYLMYRIQRKWQFIAAKLKLSKGVLTHTGEWVPTISGTLPLIICTSEKAFTWHLLLYRTYSLLSCH